jgi:uncharacterized protein with von Willebrand factor type A (vWA) domain
MPPKELQRNIDISVQKGEFIILVDCSGSMMGERVRLAREALVFFLKSLPMDSFFNVYRFGSEFEMFFEYGSQKYTDETAQIALAFGSDVEADMGGTEILEPLEDIFEKKNYSWLPSLCFPSDGWGSFKL